MDTKNSALEAAKARVSELESNVTNTAIHMNEKKRELKLVKDEYNDQLSVSIPNSINIYVQNGVVLASIILLVSFFFNFFSCAYFFVLV